MFVLQHLTIMRILDMTNEKSEVNYNSILYVENYFQFNLGSKLLNQMAYTH